MSPPLPSAGRKPAAPDHAMAAESLAALRAELDGLDDALHDALMRRAGVVARVAVLKSGGVALRPGREAAIIRRLLARHRGPLPAQTIVRVWREMLAGMTAIQGRFVLTVADPDPEAPRAQLAREHFGALIPLRLHRRPAQAIADVAAGRASAAVLPMPSEGEPAAGAWWRGLLRHQEPRVHIVAKLPFWAARGEGSPNTEALVASAIAPDASGEDRSLIGLEAPADGSRARLIATLAAAGFSLGHVLMHRDPEANAIDVLVDVAGFVTDADPRLAAPAPLARRPVVLGAYAVPIREAAASDAERAGAEAAG